MGSPQILFWLQEKFNFQALCESLKAQRLLLSWPKPLLSYMGICFLTQRLHYIEERKRGLKPKTQ